jgi:UDP-GlcNAc:undecaprenyl-phosphate GlcNAc-1-phosphate transferase
MMFCAVGVLVLSYIGRDASRGTLGKAIVLLCASVFVFFVGLFDDIKAGGLAAEIRLLAQIAAAIAVCAVGIRVRSITVVEGLTLDFGWFSWPLTLLWIVGITNAVNLSDGLDGLAAGISAVTCSVIAIFAIYSGQTVMAALVLALLGSLSGFLFFNFNPARIFMGDCGSTFLGFTIASASVMCSVKSATFVGIALPVLALGIPIFDTLFSMLRRIIDRRSMFAPDRRHFHHRLVDMGLKQRHAVIAIYITTLLFAGLGLFMIVARNIASLTIFFCLLLLLLIAFHAVGSVRLRETIAGLRRKYAITRRVQREIKSFEQAQLHFHNAHTHDTWWSAVCEAAERMDFAWVSLKTHDKDGNVRTEVWRPTGARSDISDVVVMNVPIRNNGMTRGAQFEIAIKVNGTIESAGHRATLFSRLIDEHHKLIGEFQR